MTVDFARAREWWSQAADLPPDKESIYPGHAAANGFDDHPGAGVLEYGCGGGADVLSLLRRGCDVTCCDIVPANLRRVDERVREAFLPRHWVTPIILDASAPLPFRDGLFDVVHSCGVLHHIEDPAPVVAEFARVLRSGGTAYVMLYTEHLFERCRPVVEGLISTGLSQGQAFGAVTDGSGCPYARAYDEAEGRALLTAAGFIVDRVTVYNDGDFRTFRGRRP